MATAGPSIKAIVSGATGATGQCLVPELLKSPAFSQVTVIGRRRLDIDKVFEVNQEEEEASGRLKQEVVNFDELTAENGQCFSGNDVYFCCLGTTRAKAGSAENFRKIDFDLVMKLAEIAKAAEVPHISVVSSLGANAGSMLLYLRTKGEADDGVVKLDFPRTTIYRPGALVRYGGGSVGRFFSRVLMGLPTETLARAMRIQALQQATATTGGEGDEAATAAASEQQPPAFIANAGIYALVKQETDALAASAAAAAAAAAASAAAAEGGVQQPEASDATTAAAPAEEAPTAEATASGPAAAPETKAADAEPEAPKDAEQEKPEEPAAEEPTPEEPAAEETKSEEPAAEEPAAEEPAAEEPAAEEPAAEEPAAEEPTPEEPTAEVNDAPADGGGD